MIGLGLYLICGEGILIADWLGHVVQDLWPNTDSATKHTETGKAKIYY